MKNFLIVILMSVALLSCKSTTSADKYTSTWSPFGGTKWYKVVADTLVSLEKDPNLKRVSKGCEYTVTLMKDSTLNFSISPAVYTVSNVQTASRADVSFKADFISASNDTLLFADGSKRAYSFASMSGSVKTKGADSTLSNYTVGASNRYELNVRPDVFSKRLQFNVTLQWKNYTGTPAPTSATPAAVQIKIVLSDLVMNVYDIDVIN